MERLKRWLVDRVLPVWAREELLGRIRALEEENARLRQAVAQKDEYLVSKLGGGRAMLAPTGDTCLINEGGVTRRGTGPHVAALLGTTSVWGAGRKSWGILRRIAAQEDSLSGGHYGRISV